MKTIRLLYPDHVSGGLDEYYFGAGLMAHILPENPRQPLIKVDITPPDGKAKSITNGIYAEEEVLSGIHDAQEKLAAELPDKVITIGGNCIVSLAPFDYLHGIYENTGIIWIDAHPDVSTPADYPNAHAMVLGSLLGAGPAQLNKQLKSKPFGPKDVLYVGLQGLHSYQKKFLDDIGVDYKIQNDKFISDTEIENFLQRFEHILVHFDVDVLDEHVFHSTYFADPNLKGDGSGGGRMKLGELSDILHLITDRANVIGITIAEYLPFDEYKLNRIFSDIKLFTE